MNNAISQVSSKCSNFISFGNQPTAATLPIEQNTSQKDGNKKLKLALAGLAVLGASITTGVLVSRGKSEKAKELAEQQLAKENDSFSKIFNEVKCKLPTEKGESEMTVNEFMDKYLHEFDATGKTFYHGTGLNSAQIIQKEGMKKGIRGGATTNNFSGAFFSEEPETAQRYAKEVATRGYTVPSAYNQVQETAGAVIEASLPEGSKLAQFTTDDGKFISYGIIGDMYDALKDTLDKEGLNEGKFIDYFQNILSEKGFVGARDLNAHTGITPIIFDTSKIKVDNIIKV